MQDNTLGHIAKETKELLATLAIVVVNQPPYSPDLNLIKTLWKHIREYLQFHYREYKFKSYVEQRERVKEAQTKVVTLGLLQKLIKSIPAHMQAIINVEGKFIKYQNRIQEYLGGCNS